MTADASLIDPDEEIDSLLPKYLSRTLDQRVASLPDEEPIADHGCFGYLRGVRDRALMLELRKKDGNITAISYAYIERIEFDPSTGITIRVNGQKIQIQGRHLNSPQAHTPRLFQALTQQRIPWIQEADEATIMASDPGPIVTQLLF